MMGWNDLRLYSFNGEEAKVVLEELQATEEILRFPFLSLSVSLSAFHCFLTVSLTVQEKFSKVRSSFFMA